MAEPVNLLELSKSDFQQFLDSFDHVFSDCDGVIWSGDPLPGTGEFVKKIEKHGKSVHFVSNNSLRSKEEYEEKFKSVGIERGYERLTIPSRAIGEYLKSVNFKKTIYCVSCEETRRVLESYGYKCVVGPETGSDRYQDYIPLLEDDPDIGAVVFDSDFKVNLPRLYKAITYLKRDDVLFINGATDKYLAHNGTMMMACGIFTDLVAKDVKRQPIQLGKPGKMFGEFAMKRAGVTDPSRVLFIGDMIEQDVGLGKATGFKTLLVLTSNSKETMLTSQIRPDYYANDLGSIVPLL